MTKIYLIDYNNCEIFTVKNLDDFKYFEKTEHLCLARKLLSDYWNNQKKIAEQNINKCKSLKSYEFE